MNQCFVKKEQNELNLKQAEDFDQIYKKFISVFDTNFNYKTHFETYKQNFVKSQLNTIDLLEQGTKDESFNFLKAPFAIFLASLFTEIIKLQSLKDIITEYNLCNKEVLKLTSKETSNLFA